MLESEIITRPIEYYVVVFSVDNVVDCVNIVNIGYIVNIVNIVNMHVDATLSVDAGGVFSLPIIE